jgi:hypothetical protein
MIFFTYEDGTILAAKKDCECENHDEPHWYHMDMIWKSQNQWLLDNRNFLGFAFEEQNRLREKLWQMQKHKITGIIVL